MSWHTVPKDEAWKKVTLASVASTGQMIWLRCNGCGRNIDSEPLDFAACKAIDPKTPLLLVGQRLKCTRCGARKGHCWPKPYDSLKK